MVTTVTRTGALEAARREWVKAEQEDLEVRRPFEEVSARLMDLRPALARAEAEAELARRRDAVAEGEQARARLREELAEIVGE